MEEILHSAHFEAYEKSLCTDQLQTNSADECNMQGSGENDKHKIVGSL